MEEQQTQGTVSKRRILQQISVPFLWEEKPGMPKKEWPLLVVDAPRQPGMLMPPEPDMLMLPPPLLPCRPPPPPPPPAAPAKFVVSIPFKWEEKPGTPIRSLARDPSTVAPRNKSLPLPPAYYSQFFECFDSEQESSFEDDSDDDLDWLTELDQDASSSAPSLLANRLLPVSSAIPFEAPSSPGSSSTTSPAGNSFLEQLFPLYTPKPPVKTAAEPQIKGFACAGERSIVFRRPQTLGDLIMLSRRRSYLHKAAGMRKNSVSREFEDSNAMGCCMFGSGNGGTAKLLGGKCLFTLKFV